MRMTGTAQLKSKMKNVAKDTGIPPFTVLHMYVMERFIARVAASRYRERFVLKGGYLLYSMKGMSRRTTEDLDFTSKTPDLDAEEATSVIREICSSDADDGFEMVLVKTEPVAEMLEHPGIRFFIDASFEKITERFYIDVVPSPTIVPEEVDREIKPIFGDEPICIRTYRIETVIAEKLHAALTRIDENTRMRDYYDFYVLEHEPDFDEDLLTEATRHIFEERGTMSSLENWEEAMRTIRGSDTMRALWVSYQKNHVYSGEISFDDTCDSAERLLSVIIARHPEEP